MNHREMYNRRVQNLKEYFANNLISTTDISDIEQWQGGRRCA